MGILYNTAVIFLLTVFIIATIFAQFKDSKVRKYDILGLLPSFRFFAPRPVTRDLKIYAQAIDINGNETKWKELFGGEKQWYCFLWNPQHRLRKAVIDIYSDIDEFREAKDIWHLSFPYLILLYSSTFLFNSDSNNTHVQFMITCYAGNEEQVHDIIFKSNVHAIK